MTDDRFVIIETTGDFRWAYGLYLQHRMTTRDGSTVTTRLKEQNWWKFERNMAIFTNIKVPSRVKVSPGLADVSIPAVLGERMMFGPPPVICVMGVNISQLDYLFKELGQNELDCIQCWYYPSISKCAPFLEYLERLRQYDGEGIR